MPSTELLLEISLEKLAQQQLTEVKFYDSLGAPNRLNFVFSDGTTSPGTDNYIKTKGFFDKDTNSKKVTIHIPSMGLG